MCSSNFKELEHKCATIAYDSFELKSLIDNGFEQMKQLKCANAHRDSISQLPWSRTFFDAREKINKSKNEPLNKQFETLKHAQGKHSNRRHISLEVENEDREKKHIHPNYKEYIASIFDFFPSLLRSMSA